MAYDRSKDNMYRVHLNTAPLTACSGCSPMGCCLQSGGAPFAISVLSRIHSGGCVCSFRDLPVEGEGEEGEEVAFGVVRHHLELDCRSHHIRLKSHDVRSKPHDVRSKPHDVRSKLHDVRLKSHDVRLKSHTISD
eukprot:2135185-Rhodomonas_salina.1